MISSHLKRYVVVGIVAYLSEMAVLFGLKDLVGLSSLKAVAISFWTGLVVAFILQKIVTFQNHDRSLHMLSKQLAGYSILVGFNYLFTLLMVGIFSDKVSVFVIRTAVIILSTGWNFIIYKELLFKKKEAN